MSQRLRKVVISGIAVCVAIAVQAEILASPLCPHHELVAGGAEHVHPAPSQDGQAFPNPHQHRDSGTGDEDASGVCTCLGLCQIGAAPTPPTTPPAGLRTPAALTPAIPESAEWGRASSRPYHQPPANAPPKG